MSSSEFASLLSFYCHQCNSQFRSEVSMSIGAIIPKNESLVGWIKAQLLRKGNSLCLQTQVKLAMLLNSVTEELSTPYAQEQQASDYLVKALESNSEELRCPDCQSTFIEELTQESDEELAMASQTQEFVIGSLNVDDGSDNTTEGNIRREVQNIFRSQLQVNPLFNIDPWTTMYSNPGDYVHGHGSLDDIITRILNQPLDGAGPPPLAKEAIEKIPAVKITESQVESKLQCSVCWEDFALNEEVRSLFCDHHFHDPCIIPWLELHGTCPICRKTQGSNTSSETGDSNESVASSTVGAMADSVSVAIDSIFRQHTPLTTSSTETTTSSSTSAATNESNPTNRSEDSRPDSYHDRINYNFGFLEQD